MKALPQYINEYLIKKKVDKVKDNYKYHPKTKAELAEAIKELFNKNESNLNCIDVSNIDDMESLFANIYYIYNCRNFDCDLSTWNVSNVEDMNGMFYNCETFKGEGLENWDVSNVENMYAMFANCNNIDCNLETWDVSNCEDIRNMFAWCNNMKNKPSWYNK